ncbi:MAG: hypothetical protein ACPGR2_17090 [Psychrobium sp.]
MISFIGRSREVVSAVFERSFSAFSTLLIISIFLLTSSKVNAQEPAVFVAPDRCSVVQPKTDYSDILFSSVNSGGNYGNQSKGWLDASGDKTWMRDPDDGGGWLGMVFVSPRRIENIKTRGQNHSSKKQWVTRYRVEATKTPYDLTRQANNVPANRAWAQAATWVNLGTFDGNSDKNTIVTRTISNTDKDWTAVRLVPLAKKNRWAMRMGATLCRDMNARRLWLDGDVGLYKDDLTTPATSSGNKVYSWQDRSAWNDHAKENSLQGGVASDKQPSYKNNAGNFHSALSFDGSAGNAYSMGLQLGDNSVYSWNSYEGLSIYAVATPKESDSSINSYIYDFGAFHGKGLGLRLNQGRAFAYVSSNSGGSQLTHDFESSLSNSSPAMIQLDILFDDKMLLKHNGLELVSIPISLDEFTANEVNHAPTYGSNTASPVSIG